MVIFLKTEKYFFVRLQKKLWNWALVTSQTLELNPSGNNLIVMNEIDMESDANEQEEFGPRNENAVIRELSILSFDGAQKCIRRNGRRDCALMKM